MRLIAEPTYSYRVRGVVKELSGKGVDARVALHHEAIPDFKDRDGKAATMHAMIMSFGFAESLPPSTFVPEEKVEIEFDVRFSKTPPLLITRVQKLPEGTQLVLPTE
jgi:hypothetical protein